MIGFRDLLHPTNTARISGPPPYRSALEFDFPAVEISKIAEAESWRKEVHRPASHTHKWWAQRLGSVFRAIIIAAYSESGVDTVERINGGLDLSGVKLLDPFAGSGTTLVEARKLGADCAGVDINPVASLVQRQALQPWREPELKRLMVLVEGRCRAEIDELHVDVSGDSVLYYFWVAQAKCPQCREVVDLFSDWVFAKHAYPSRFPIARAICGDCDSIETVDLSMDRLGCCANGHDLDRPSSVIGQRFTCSSGHTSRIIDALDGGPPDYRMYAKIVLRGDVKEYVGIDDFDRRLYAEATRRLHSSEGLLGPSGKLADGYNTRQAMRWGFTEWRQFFNDRQLYSLGLLGSAIHDLPDSPEREALCVLFSGVLEFNNLFCSFKGEGTGAVRHLFSHHVLKPERTPVEAHPWGTPKSSGSFSTLFKSRLLRAHAYKEDPHDLTLTGANPDRRHGLSQPLSGVNDALWEVVTGDSGQLPYRDGTFDLVVTDPPYFDQVHYSELADFFHVWLLGLAPFDGYGNGLSTTRSPDEVQDTDIEVFGQALGRVFETSARVLRTDGLLVFSFHHTKSRAWLEVAQALRSAKLVVTSIQPVKAEMATSVTKRGAREPNDLDSLVVCRPRRWIDGWDDPPRLTPSVVSEIAVKRLQDLSRGDVQVGAADIRSVMLGSVIALATWPDYFSMPLETHVVQAELIASDPRIRQEIHNVNNVDCRTNTEAS